MTRNSKLKLEVNTNAFEQLIPEIALSDSKENESSRAFARKKKEEAEKPFYFNRI